MSSAGELNIKLTQDFNGVPFAIPSDVVVFSRVCEPNCSQASQLITVISAPESNCILTLVSPKLTSVYLRLALRSPSIFLILGCLVGPLLLWQSFCGQSFFRWSKDPQRKQAPLVEARGFSLLGRSCRFFFLWTNPW